MFNTDKKNQEIQSFDNLPGVELKIPVSRAVANLLLALCTRRLGAVSIDLEALRADPTKLVISSIINESSEETLTAFAVYNNDDVKSLKELVESMVDKKLDENEHELTDYYRKLNEEEDEDWPF